MSTAFGSEDGKDGERSVGQLFASATADLSKLVHDEIALAKVEIGASVKRGGIGAAMGVAAGVILVASIPMFSFALAYGLHYVFADWIGWHGYTLGWAIFTVGFLYVVLAALLGLIGYKKFLAKVSPPAETIESTKATVEVLKSAKPHPAPELPGGDRLPLTK